LKANNKQDEAEFIMEFQTMTKRPSLGATSARFEAQLETANCKLASSSCAFERAHLIGLDPSGLFVVV